ncbi:MAG: hypothetical protein WD016_04830 [Balneolaceae bacterium]
MKFINSKIHGIIDYLFIVVLIFIPLFLDLSGFVTSYIYVLATLAFLIAITTDYEVGAFRRIPFPMHGIIELFFGILLVISPWIFQFADLETERNIFLVLGLFVLLLFTFTKFKRDSSKNMASSEA